MEEIIELQKQIDALRQKQYQLLDDDNISPLQYCQTLAILNDGEDPDEILGRLKMVIPE